MKQNQLVWWLSIKHENPFFAQVQRQVPYMQKLTQPIIMIDKPQEAEDQHLQQIFQVFFSLHLIYQLQCYMR